MSLHTYDPSKVVLVIKGIPISGYTDGTGIKVSRSNDMYTKKSGMDGVTSRAKSSDRSGEVVITLTQTSPSNDILSALAAIDDSQGAGVTSILISDLSGTSLHGSSSAWIRKFSDAEYGKEISDRQWTIDCADLTMHVGGNIINLSGLI
jgi:arabinogalactan endo-1,4-beta-galactosidase